LRTAEQSTILFVGRLESRKGLLTLIEAYGQLRRARADARLVVVGDGPMRWGYESQVAAMGIPDVEFAGRVSAELLPSYYASADVFCAPATGGESFGIVLLEAMASGVPVIASSIPGFSSVVSNEFDGMLVPPRHPKEWAAALGALLDDAPRRRAMSERGLAKAQLYDWNHVVDEVLDVYRVARARASASTVASGVHLQAPGVG